MASHEQPRSRPTRISAADFSALAGRPAPRKPQLPHREWSARGQTGSQQPYRLRLPFLPPSVNKLFTTVRDPQSGVIKRVLTQKARKIRRLISALVDRQLNPAALYELHIDIHLPCFTKEGKVRKLDLSNRVKFIEDCVCTALGIDDSSIFRVVLTKHDSEMELTTLDIRELDRQAGRDAA